MASTPRPAPAPLRREQIADLVSARGFVRVLDLAAQLEVSEVTIRTDLTALEDDGRVRRVHGGAMPAQDVREHAFEEAAVSAPEQKEAIGAAAAAMVRPGQSLVLDVGTTTTALARTLVRQTDLDGLTVITNGLNIALLLEEAADRFTVVVTGGTLRRLQHSLVDPLGTVLLDQLAPDLAFVGCNGVSAEHGITNVNLPEAQVKARMVARAARTVVLADASKVGRVHLGSVCPMSAVDTLVTTPGPDGELAAIRDLGVTVAIADA